MKKIVFSILISFVTLNSCNEFLEEEMVATLTQGRYDTEAGIEELVNGAYEGLRFHFNYEWSYAMTNYGTDEFTNGGGKDRLIWNTYAATLDPTETNVLAPYWENMYAQINLHNIGIQRIPEVLAGDLQNELRDTRLGELYFLRGFNYYKLVTQFGGVPISLDPIEADVSEFSRATAEEVFEVVIRDLRRAVELLPETVEQQGRISKAAAQHFLAKAYLTRASELNEEFSKETDLDSAAYLADLVIESPNHQLADNYHELFNYTGVNGPNEQLSEILLAAQFENTQSLLGRYGNQTHLYFLSVYQTYPGMIRDLVNGREFQRLRPTAYALDVYDRVNDSRFYKSFKTSYLANNANTLPVWTEEDAPAPDMVGVNKFNVGDTSIVYIVNSPDDMRFTEEYQESTPYLMLVRYYPDENGNIVTDFSETVYPSLSKYLDPYRASVGEAKGTRDGILARLGETYLIAAEAYGRMGDYATAVERINTLRRRAAYKEGEVRNNVYYLAENISFGESGSTVEELEITEAAFTPGTPEAAAEIYPPNVSSQDEMFVHFILNERARELMGEFHRWVDLARTNTLLPRVVAYNPEAAPNIAERHIFRPIPQEYLDGVTRNGANLTSAEREQVQNPGY